MKVDSYIVDAEGITHDGKRQIPPNFSWGHQM